MIDRLRTCNTVLPFAPASGRAGTSPATCRCGIRASLPRPERSL